MIVPAIGHWAEAAPWPFAFGLFFALVLLYSQAATTHIGESALNHSFMIPGVIATSVTVVTGLALAGIVFQLR